MPTRNTFPFNLGDIVQFKGAINETGLTEIRVTKGDETTVYKSGQVKMIPPVMVVVEIVKEDKKKAHLYDEKTGNPIGSLFKARCIWFSQNTGKYEERWFNSKAIIVVHKKSIEKSTLLINSNVSLRTKLYSDDKLEEIFEPKLKGNLDEPEIKYKITRTFNNLTFIPPVMLIVGKQENKVDKDLPLFDKTTGEKKRIISDKNFKCMWYDYKSGKFSEKHFPPEALVQIEEYDFNQKIMDYIKPK